MHRFQSFLITALLLAATSTLFGQMKRMLVVLDPGGKNVPEERTDLPKPYPLSQWIQNEKEALKKLNQDDSPQVRQKVTTLGTLSGHKVIQVITTAYLPSPNPSETGSQRKSLLVQVAHGQRYTEIYRLEDDAGLALAMQSATIYGSGPNAILETFDLLDRNDCSQRSWWFNAAGAHPVDFSSLRRTISEAIPPDGTYNMCWAVRSEDKAQLDIWIQRRNPECRACDWMGRLTAKYRNDHGIAVPVSVEYRADRSPNNQPQQ